MAEKDEVFSSKIKQIGNFNFAEFYRFCYDYLSDELGLNVCEDGYSEKIIGDAKNIDIKWTVWKKVTDYFKFESKIAFRILGLKKVEITTQDGKKIKTNEGNAEIKMKGYLIRDWHSKFETTAWNKFLRSIYEKYVISSRIDQMEDKVAAEGDEFLSQAKAWLDIEGKR